MNQSIVTSYPLLFRYLKHDKVTSYRELIAVANILITVTAKHQQE
jgi:hypothetical protein